MAGFYVAVGVMDDNVQRAFDFHFVFIHVFLLLWVKENTIKCSARRNERLDVFGRIEVEFADEEKPLVGTL